MGSLAIIYGTGFGNTGLMAQAIEEGAKSAGVGQSPNLRYLMKNKKAPFGCKLIVAMAKHVMFPVR